MPKVNPPKLKTKKVTVSRETCSADDLYAWRRELSEWLGVPVSQARLAKEAGISTQAIDSFEKGDRSVPEKVILAARRLGEKLAPLRKLAQDTRDAKLVFRTMQKTGMGIAKWSGSEEGRQIIIHQEAKTARAELDAESEARWQAHLERRRVRLEKMREGKARKKALRAAAEGLQGGV